MEHRHINLKYNEWNAAAVHSIWECGTEQDICAFIREVKINANAADAVRSAIPHSKRSKIFDSIIHNSSFAPLFLYYHHKFN